MQNSNIMSVKEMIEVAFGNPRGNVVNHKLMHTILLLLARQLQLLERRVEVEIGSLPYAKSGSSISITELKLHTKQKKKNKMHKHVYTPKDAKGVAKNAGRPLATGGGKEQVAHDTKEKISAKATSIKGEKDYQDTKEVSSSKGDKSYPERDTTQMSEIDASARQEIYKGTEEIPGIRSVDKRDLSGDALQKSLTEEKSAAIAAYEKKVDKKPESFSVRTSSTTKTSSESSVSSEETSTSDISSSTSSDLSSSDKTSTDFSSTVRTISSSDKTASALLSIDKTASISDKTTTEISSTDQSSSEKNSTDKTSTDKTSTEKTSTDKTSTDKTSTDKTSTDKTSTDKTSTDKTSTDKTSTDKTSTDKTSSSKTATDKTLSVIISMEKTDIPADKIASTDKTEKSSTEKSATDKTSSLKPSTDKSSSDYRSSSMKTSTDKTSTDVVSTDKISSIKDKAPTRKPSTEKVTAVKKPTKKPTNYQKLLDIIEERREAELRVIHQRTDSFEEPRRTPTPMASLDSVEAKYEKLLIVERIPSKETRNREARRDRTSELSLVTQEQFDALEEKVCKLRENLSRTRGAGFPENAKLMGELRKGASLTDAVSALQLSARLETAENTLGQMLSIVTDLARKSSRIDLTAPIDVTIMFGPKSGVAIKSGTEPRLVAGVGLDIEAGEEAGVAKAAKGKPSAKILKTMVKEDDHTTAEPALAQSFVVPEEDKPVEEEEMKVDKADCVTYEELDNAMQELHDELMKNVTTITTRSTVSADSAYKTATRIDGKLNTSLNLGNRMVDLETLIANYADQINTLDTGLSTQMTNYQDELTQMQHDLETGLETMAEVLANSGADTSAVADLNTHFNTLQLDFDNMAYRQKELKLSQSTLSLDLQALWKELELLRSAKSDREEVSEALRDKAGIGALNGLVALQQFEAVRGDFEKQIGAAYDKFNSQEVVWQKAIDELLRSLNEKAEAIQVMCMNDEISKHIDALKSRLHAMLEIVGEPQERASLRLLHRDTACISCSTPAQPEKVSTLPVEGVRRPAFGTPDLKTKGDGDQGRCYFGLPIPHPVDPRSRVCQRYCGGSHTRISNTIGRTPPGINITNPVVRPISTGPGIDGKMYMLDATTKKVPCLPCNEQKATTPGRSIKTKVSNHADDGSGMTPPDFHLTSQLTMRSLDNDLSTTPPPPLDDDSI